MQSFHVEGCGNGFTHEQNHEYRMACEQTKVAYEVTKQKDKEMAMACEVTKQKDKEMVMACELTKQKDQEIEILKLQIELKTLTRKRKGEK